MYCTICNVFVQFVLFYFGFIVVILVFIMNTYQILYFLNGINLIVSLMIVCLFVRLSLRFYLSIFLDFSKKILVAKKGLEKY